MYIRPRKLPYLLRSLAWCSIGVGALGAAAIAADVQAGNDVRPAHAISAALWIWGGFRTLRGAKDGVDSLLAAWTLPAIALVLLPFLDADQRAAIPGWLYGYVLFALATTVYLYSCRRRLPWAERVEHEPGSYGHWLTDPSARDDVAVWFRRKDAALEADRESPPDAEDLIHALVDPSQDFELIRMRLQQLVSSSDDGCVPALVAGLADPQCQESERARKLLVRLLPEPAPPSAADALRACVDGAKGSAGDVLEALAATGDPDHLDVLVPALDSADTGRDVAAGLAQAFAAGRATPDHIRALLPGLVRALDGPAHGSAAMAARALLALDREAATEEILDGIRAGSGGRLDALVELHRQGARIPASTLAELWRQTVDSADARWVEALLPMLELDERELLDVIRRMDPQVPGYRACRAITAALRALVDLGSPQARTALESAIARDAEDLSDTAAGLLCRLHDLPESPFVDPTRAESLEARYHHTLSLACSYARNGGIVHALECLDEDEAEVLEAGLRAVGPREVAEIWQEAIRLLMRGPLPPDLATRRERIAEWHGAVTARLAELDTAFYEVDHRLDVQLCRYAIANRASILPALAAPEA
ncbi:MAG: DUF4375 domain-containing protein [Planctomycetota bacterium]|nr:DUF4375 domain-containing protein [Planctomycetota bacterium]